MEKPQSQLLSVVLPSAKENPRFEARRLVLYAPGTSRAIFARLNVIPLPLGAGRLLMIDVCEEDQMIELDAEQALHVRPSYRSPPGS